MIEAGLELAWMLNPSLIFQEPDTAQRFGHEAARILRKHPAPLLLHPWAVAIMAAEPPPHAMIDFVNGDSMVRDGQRGELRAVLAAQIGATESERFVENIAAPVDVPTPPPAPEPEKPAGPDESSGQGSLF